jgi:hypothetical protein
MTANLIMCESCEWQYPDRFMWWTGRFWFCLDCSNKSYEIVGEVL